MSDKKIILPGLVVKPGDVRFENMSLEKQIFEINKGFMTLAQTSRNAIIELRRKVELLTRTVRRLENEHRPAKRNAQASCRTITTRNRKSQRSKPQNKSMAHKPVGTVVAIESGERT